MYSKVQGKGWDLSGRNSLPLVTTKIKSLMYAEEVLLSDKNWSQRNISLSCIQSKIKISIGKSFSKVSNNSKTFFMYALLLLKVYMYMNANRVFKILFACHFSAGWKQEIQSNGKTCCLWINKDFLMDGNTEGDRHYAS